MKAWSMLFASAAATQLDAVRFALAAAAPAVRPKEEARSGCAIDPRTDDVVICVRRIDSNHVPLPDGEDPDARGRSAREGGGMAALTPSEPCGIFAGQRRCGRAEASRSGYGDGRDPITLMGRLARHALGSEGD